MAAEQPNNDKIQAFKKRLDYYMELVTECPSESQSTFHRAATILEELGKTTQDSSYYAGAIKLYTEAAKYFPNDSLVFTKRSNLYGMLGEIDEAAADFVKAVKLGSTGDPIMDMYGKNLQKHILKLEGVAQKANAIIETSNLPSGLKEVFADIIGTMQTMECKISCLGTTQQQHTIEINQNIKDIANLNTNMDSVQLKIQNVAGDNADLTLIVRQLQEDVLFLKEKVGVMEKTISDRLLKDAGILASLIDQEKIKEEVKHELEDPRKYALYHTICWHLNSTYLASQVITIGMVDSKKQNRVGQVGTIVHKIGEFTPVVGIGLKLIGELLKKIDHAIQVKKIARFADIAKDVNEMVRFAEDLAVKLVKLDIPIPENKDTWCTKIAKFILDGVADIASGSAADEFLGSVFEGSISKAANIAVDTIPGRVEDYAIDVLENQAAEMIRNYSKEDVSQKTKQMVSYAKRLVDNSTKAEEISQDELEANQGEKEGEIVSELVIALIYGGILKGAHKMRWSIDQEVEEVFKYVTREFGGSNAGSTITKLLVIPHDSSADSNMPASATELIEQKKQIVKLHAETKFATMVSPTSNVPENVTSGQAVQEQHSFANKKAEVSNNKVKTQVCTLMPVYEIQYTNPLLNHQELLQKCKVMYGPKFTKNLIDLCMQLDKCEVEEICHDENSLEVFAMLMGQDVYTTT